jgi:hypothetical protein
VDAVPIEVAEGDAMVSSVGPGVAFFSLKI